VEVSGIAKVSAFELVLEYEAWQIGLPRSGVKEVRIPITELESVSLKDGWLKTELLVKARSLSTLNGVPGSSRGQVPLRVPRKEREAARQAFAMLKLNLAEAEIERLREESDRLANSSLAETKTKLLP
jgi:hypothetical protein